MTQASEITIIVDYLAAMAGGIDGITAVFGAGQGVVVDPLRPGQFIEPRPANPTSHLSYWVDLPRAPAVQWVSQSGMVELTWQVPGRLWLAGADQAEAVRQCLPFYDKFLRALVTDNTLGGMVLRSEVSAFTIGGAKDWAWLNVGYTAVERINYSA